MKRGRLPRPKSAGGKVSVAYLHPGEVSECFADSLLTLFIADMVGPQRILSHSCGKLAKRASSAGVVSGRNQVAKIICDESEAEWLFFVDSDMGFAPDTVERLLAAADRMERPVVGALAFACKTDGDASFGGVRYRAQPTLYDFVDLDDRIGFAPRFTYPPNEVLPVAGTGAACILIHRSALETIRAKYGDVWFDPITHPKGPTTFSEDLSFCVRLAGCGIPIHVHTGVKTTHDKGFAFLDEEFYIAQEIAAGRSGTA